LQVAEHQSYFSSARACARWSIVDGDKIDVLSADAARMMCGRSAENR